MLPLYTAEEIAEFEANLRRDYTFGRSRGTSPADLLDMARMAEGGEAFNDPNDGKAQRMRVCVRVWRELAEKRRNAIYKSDPIDEDPEPKSNPTGNNTSRSGKASLLATEKQLDHVKSNLRVHGMTPEDFGVTWERLEFDSPTRISKDKAGAMLDTLFALPRKMSDGQRDLLIKLTVEDGVREDVATLTWTNMQPKTLFADAGKMIDKALAAQKAAAKSNAGVPEEGFYECGDLVIKVQRGVTSGNLFVKTLNIIEGVGAEWVYQGSAAKFLKGLKDVTPLTQKRALEVVAEMNVELELYGVCWICGRKLTDELSMARRIGRICFEKLA